MWISYAGRDSSELVEAVVRQLEGCCSKLSVNRYKKRISVVDQLQEEHQSVADERAQDDWPVLPTGVSEQEQFHLLPMDELFDLVVEIAFSSRVLVVLSPAYLQSGPCLQELAAIISLKTRPLPLIVLNGLTHDEVRSGRISIDQQQPSHDQTIIDVAAELVRARNSSQSMDKVGSLTPITCEEVSAFLEEITERNIPAIKANFTTEQLKPEADSTGEEARQTLDQCAQSVVEAVKSHFVELLGSDGYCKQLQGKDQKRFSAWFTTKFGRILLEKINIDRAQKAHLSAVELVQELMSAPKELHESIIRSVLVMREERAEAAVGGLGEFKDDDAWNICLSELAGLYALILLDHESLESLKVNSASDLCFLTFTTGKFQACFKACLVNSSVQDSLLRIRPTTDPATIGAPDPACFDLFEKDSSASEQGAQFARDFVEALYMHVSRKSSQSCPRSDPAHPTGMSAAERLSLRGQIKRLQRKNGPGSLVLTINKADIETGQSWWDEWDAVHAALNDEASPHASVRLRGIVINKGKGTATIQMHKDYEERLDYINELLEEHYLQ